MKPIIEKTTQTLSKLSRRTWLLIILAVVLIVFYNVAEDVHDHETLSIIDPFIGQWLATHVSSLPLVLTIAQNITRFGSWNVLKIILIIFTLFVLYKKQWFQAGILGISILTGEYLNWAIKEFFMRPRPDFLSSTSQIDGYSFPSNHSMSAVIFYGMLAYLITTLITHRNARIWIWSLTSGLILAIGLSRLVLGVHYMTDVLGGWLAGGTWLLVCILVSEILLDTWGKISPGFQQKFKKAFGN